MVKNDRSQVRVDLSESITDPLDHRFQRCIEPFRVRSAGLRKIGTTAALAANLLGHRPNDVARVDSIRVVPRYARGQANLSVVDGTQDDNRAFELVLETIDRVPERPRIGPVHPFDHHFDPANFGDVARRVAGASAQELLPDLGQIFLQFFIAFQELLDLLSRLLARTLER